jgi:hypothetical protein
VKDYPDFKHYISDDATIVEDVVFERAIMKIARVQGDCLSPRTSALQVLDFYNPMTQMFKAMRMHHLVGNMLKITYKAKSHIPKRWSESSSDSEE